MLSAMLYISSVLGEHKNMEHGTWDFPGDSVRFPGISEQDKKKVSANASNERSQAPRLFIFFMKTSREISLLDDDDGGAAGRGYNNNIGIATAHMHTYVYILMMFIDN